MKEISAIIRRDKLPETKTALDELGLSVAHDSER